MSLLLLPLEGGIRTVPFTGSDRFDQLKELLHGGFVQMLHLTPSLAIAVDEDGKLKNAPLNLPASLVLAHFTGLADGIAGDAVLVGSTRGEITEVLPEDEAAIRALFR